MTSSIPGVTYEELHGVKPVHPDDMKAIVDNALSYQINRDVPFDYNWSDTDQENVDTALYDYMCQVIKTYTQRQLVNDPDIDITEQATYQRHVNNTLEIVAESVAPLYEVVGTYTGTGDHLSHTPEIPAVG